MIDIDKILTRLDGVRRGERKDHWRAICPAHESKHRTPSLSIGLAEDRVLIHCFAGCGASDVMASVGLSLSDLFDDPPKESGPRRFQPDYKGMLQHLQEEVYVVSLAAASVCDGKKLNEADVERVRAASAKIDEVRKHASGV